MAIGGKNASFEFATVVYDADDCLQDWGMSDAINNIVYQCNGFDKNAAGTRSATFRTSLGLNASDTTRITAFSPGTTGIFAAYPAGKTTDFICYEATKATAIVANVTAPINGIIQVDIELALDDIAVSSA